MHIFGIWWTFRVYTHVSSAADYDKMCPLHLDTSEEDERIRVPILSATVMVTLTPYVHVHSRKTQQTLELASSAHIVATTHRPHRPHRPRIHSHKSDIPNTYDCFWLAHLAVACLASNSADGGAYARFSAQLSHGVSMHFMLIRVALACAACINILSVKIALTTTKIPCLKLHC